MLIIQSFNIKHKVIAVIGIVSAMIVITLGCFYMPYKFIHEKYSFDCRDYEKLLQQTTMLRQQNTKKALILQQAQTDFLHTKNSFATPKKVVTQMLEIMKQCGVVYQAIHHESPINHDSYKKYNIKFTMLGQFDGIYKCLAQFEKLGKGVTFETYTLHSSGENITMHTSLSLIGLPGLEA